MTDFLRQLGPIAFIKTKESPGCGQTPPRALLSFCKRELLVEVVVIVHPHHAAVFKAVCGIEPLRGGIAARNKQPHAVEPRGSRRINTAAQNTCGEPCVLPRGPNADTRQLAGPHEAANATADRSAPQSRRTTLLRRCRPLPAGKTAPFAANPPQSSRCSGMFRPKCSPPFQPESDKGVKSPARPQTSPDKRQILHGTPPPERGCSANCQRLLYSAFCEKSSSGCS